MKPKQLVQLIGALAIAIAVFAWVKTRDHRQGQEAPSPQASALPIYSGLPAPVGAVPSVAPSAAVSDQVLPEAYRFEFPKVSTLRAQTANDPHQTPRALMELSGKMSVAMTRALSSEPEARQFFQVLAECAREQGPEQPIQVRGICLANASRLSQRYPDALGKPYEGLRAEMPHSVRVILDAAGY